MLVVGHNGDWKKIYCLPRLVEGAVNRLDAAHVWAAGKGANTTRALRSLGETALLLGYAGGHNGRRFREALAREGLACRLIRTSGETRTCVTVLEEDPVQPPACSGGAAATEIIEPSSPLSPGEHRRFQRHFERLLPSARLLLVVGTSLPGSPEDCYRRYLEAARSRGIPTLLDSYQAHGRNALAAGPTIFKINLHELESLAGRSLPDPRERKDFYGRLCARYDIGWVLITRGAAGIEGFDGRNLLLAAPPRVRVVNPIGSGDATSAGVASSYLRSEDLRTALTKGVAMGTANCLNLFPGQVRPEDYRRLLGEVAIEEL
jgi:tagatose 6-phosphate kinase